MDSSGLSSAPEPFSAESDGRWGFVYLFFARIGRSQALATRPCPKLARAQRDSKGWHEPQAHCPRLGLEPGRGEQQGCRPMQDAAPTPRWNRRRARNRGARDRRTWPSRFDDLVHSSLRRSSRESTACLALSFDRRGGAQWSCWPSSPLCRKGARSGGSHSHGSLPVEVSCWHDTQRVVARARDIRIDF